MKLDEVLFYNIDKAIRSYRQFAQLQLKQKGISITIDQWLVLKTLQENPGVQQREIARMVFKDNASVTRIIDLLVKEACLLRSTNAADRRMTTITITARGRAMIKKIVPLIEQNRAQALNGISDSAIRETQKVLNKISRNCQPEG